MKKIKFILSFVVCLFVFGAAYSQTPAKDNVATLDKMVHLDESQKVQAEAIYQAYFDKIAGMSNPEDIRGAKTSMKAEIDAILTAEQRNKMNQRISSPK